MFIGRYLKAYFGSIRLDKIFFVNFKFSFCNINNNTNKKDPTKKALQQRTYNTIIATN